MSDSSHVSYLASTALYGLQVSDSSDDEDAEWAKPRGMRSDAAFAEHAARVRPPLLPAREGGANRHYQLP